ncbi:right-handed parallel beta-helix repeat-containing protein [Halorientalis marina]|uniref:right-handed parallel beta-helix repeat-containing protein n=1 Tax=Halorientalis marina TaxID=2931976 RepID=UPI001FF3A547|nr:right-handed parallel beta-helix repeat-containing protein [Halorientalis marina]
MDRRKFLKLSGAMGTVGALTIFSSFSDGNEPVSMRKGDSVSRNRTTSEGVPTQTPEQMQTSYRAEIEFDRVLDAVDDIGMDDSGEIPIDEALAANLEDGTLIEFPPGEYLTKTIHSVENLKRWGIRGRSSDRTDVRIRPQEEAGHHFINIRSGRDVLVENLTFDVRQGRHEWLTNTFKLAGGLRLNNVEYAGFYASDVTARQAQPATSVQGPLHVHVTDPDGVSIIDSLVRSGPTHHAEYPGGHSCIFVGPAETVGTLYIRNSHIENMSSHGIYASRTRGNIRIENTTFKNNNGAGVRISGTGSYIRDSEIILDRSEVIEGTLGNVFTSVSSGMWFESGFRTQAGGMMDRCQVTLRDVPDLTRAIEVDGSAGQTTISNTDIYVGSGNVRPVDINKPGRSGSRVRTRGRVPDNPRVDILNVRITGQSSGREAVIDVSDRESVLIANSRIDFQGDRDGITFENAAGYVVDGTTVNLESAGTGIIAIDSPNGIINDTDISVVATPIRISMSDSPNTCSVQIAPNVTLESEQGVEPTLPASCSGQNWNGSSGTGDTEETPQSLVNWFARW